MTFELFQLPCHFSMIKGSIKKPGHHEKTPCACTLLNKPWPLSFYARCCKCLWIDVMSWPISAKSRFQIFQLNCLRFKMTSIVIAKTSHQRKCSSSISILALSIMIFIFYVFPYLQMYHIHMEDREDKFQKNPFLPSDTLGAQFPVFIKRYR